MKPSTPQNMENVFEPKAIRILKSLLGDELKPKTLVSKTDFMPTHLKKRRVVYCEDNIWKQIEDKAGLYRVSISSALRQVLQKGLNS